MSRKNIIPDINSMCCERLTHNRINKNKIRTFTNEKNEILANHLKYKAWFEDKSNKCAHYIIKDNEKVVMYFSLRSAMIIKETRKSNFEDEEYSLNKIKVSNTYPCIEMVHFCVNDTYKKRVSKKEWYKKESSLVRLLYFKFVIPQVYKIAENLGVEYFYLFAADKTEDRTLVNYYSQKLFFREHIKSKKYIEPMSFS